jgi:hypothetical protein
MNQYGPFWFVLPSSLIVLVGEDRCNRQRRVRERNEHFHGASGVVEADPAEVGQSALGEVSGARVQRPGR